MLRRAVLALSLALLPTLFLAPSARADLLELMGSKNWENEDVMDEQLGTQSCRVYTNSSDATDATVQLALSFPKDGLRPPALFVKTTLSAPLVSVKVASDRSEPLFLLHAAQNEGEANIYWYAPVDFVRLERYIRAKDQLELYFDPQGAARRVKVSLAGSSATLDQNRKCLNKGVAIPKDFFALLNQEKDNLVPDLGDRTPAFLLASVHHAYDAFLAGQRVNVSLAKLRETVAPLLRKEANALKVQQDALQKRDRAQTKLNEARAEVSTIETNLAAARADLASLQTEKPKAEADLAAKRAAYLPLKEQMVPYEKKIAETDKAVKDFEKEIDRNESVISRNERAIRNLEAERSNLSRSIPGLERDAADLRSAYSRADSEYNSYRPDYEKRRIIDSDSSYSWAKRDLENGQRELDSARSDYSRANGRVRDVTNRLWVCKQDPAQNCSSLESEYYSAQQEERQAQSRMSSAESTIRSAQWKMDSIESDAQRKVDQESSRLRGIRDSYLSAMNEKERQLSYARARIAEIRSEIPSLQRQIEKAKDALPGLRSSLAQAEAARAEAIAARDSFSQSIGFGAAEQAFRAAESHLAAVNKGISDRTKEIPSLERALVRAQRNVDPLVKDLTRREADLASATAKLAPIQAELKGFREQESVVLAELAREQEKFQLQRATYQDLYRELLGR